MTQENLEETTTQAEVVEPTPTEEVEPTEPKKEPTVSITDTPEFKKALDKAVGKGVSSIQSQLSISKAEAAAAKAERDVIKSLQEDTERMMAELEERQFADDPEALKGFRNTKRIELREKKATLREKEQDRRDAELDGLRWAITMNNKANELQALYQVPRETLELCTSEEQMEKIAKAFPEVGKKEPEKEAPKFAGAGEGGKGVDWRKLPPQQRIDYGLKHPKK